MPTTTRLGRPLLGPTIASMIVACSGAASSAPVPPAAPARSLAPSASSPVPELVGQSDAWLVVGHPGDDRLHVILASTEEEMVSPADRRTGRRLGPRHHRHPGSVRHHGGGPPGGTWLRRTRARGHGILAPADDRPRSGPGRSFRGRLDDRAGRRPTRARPRPPARAGSPCSSRTLDRDARVIELAGTFEFDALSPDGSLLYVIEQLPGPPAGHYQVRVVETATGVLRPAVVADKTKIDEAMAGWPIAQDRRPDGLVFTLYRGTRAPVHPRAQQRRGMGHLHRPAGGRSGRRRGGARLGPDARAGRSPHPGHQRDARACGRRRSEQLRDPPLGLVRSFRRARDHARQVRAPAERPGRPAGRDRARRRHDLCRWRWWHRPDRLDGPARHRALRRGRGRRCHGRDARRQRRSTR